MVAVIHASSSLRNALHYNEHKLKIKAATLIHSMHYGKDMERLGFTDKIGRLEKLAALNENTKVNSVHISLNFDPSEKLSADKLRLITESYMEKIGFGNQPYLVYQHHDAGHPHIHIVTTNIRQDGRRIKLHNLGRIQSEAARKQIEKDFKLVQAQRQQQKLVHELKPVALKINYGKSEIKRGITNVLDSVLHEYKYASLPELNAILKQYDIVADRGQEDSRTFKNGGLVYRVLNEKGEKIGAPIKASDFYNKPTLKFLSEKFELNEPKKLIHKQRVKNAIDLAFIKRPGLTLPELIKTLQKEKIQTVIRQNDQGVIYGMTYVDQQTKCVFNGSQLGKQYSSNAIQFRCNTITHEQQLQQHQSLAGELLKNVNEMAQELTEPEYQGALAAELRNEHRRRKRKRLHH